MSLPLTASFFFSSPLFRPAYATHALLACYVFLPLTENLHAFVLGITATTCYLATLSLITYRNTPDCITKVNPPPAVQPSDVSSREIDRVNTTGNVTGPRGTLAYVILHRSLFCFPIADHHRRDILRVRERVGALLQVHERGRHQALLPGPAKVRRVHTQAQLREGSRSRSKLM